MLVYQRVGWLAGHHLLDFLSGSHDLFEIQTEIFRLSLGDAKKEWDMHHPIFWTQSSWATLNGLGHQHFRVFNRTKPSKKHIHWYRHQCIEWNIHRESCFLLVDAGVIKSKTWLKGQGKICRTNPCLNQCFSLRLSFRDQSIDEALI